MIFLNLLEGVAIGLGVAIFMLLTRLVRAPIEARPYGDAESKNWRIDIDGTLSFLLLPRLTTVLSTMPPGSMCDSRSTRTTSTRRSPRPFPIGDSLTRRRAESSSSSRRRRRRCTAHTPAGPNVITNARRPMLFRATATTHRRRGFILDGVDAYHRNGRGELYPRLAELTEATTPSAVFLTCADSRVLPDVITASGPR